MSRITFTFIATAVVALLLWPAPAAAQCTGDPCLFFTPTPAPTSTPIPTAGAGTPSIVAPPTAAPFPQYQYGIPTAIPTIQLPPTPKLDATITPLPTFQPLSPDFTPPPLPTVTFEPLATPELPSTTPLATFEPFNATPWAGEPLATFEPFNATPWAGESLATFEPFSGSAWGGTPLATFEPFSAAPFDFSFSTPTLPGSGGTAVPLSTMQPGLAITYPTVLTQFTTFTGTIEAVEWASGVLTDVISYTNALTASVVQPTQAITVITAPADYVPSLPRPLANIGWTFEQLGDPNSTVTFTVDSWAAMVGYMASTPFQLTKMLWLFAQRHPVLTIVLSWLFIVFALVVGIRLLKAIYHLVITVIDVVTKLIDLIGQYLPTGG